jgi:hypothetical protein
MPPLLNDDHSAEQVRSDNRSFGASTATTTIHQHDLDRCKEQKRLAESVRVVSPGGQSNSNHHDQVPTACASSHDQVPAACSSSSSSSSSTKSVIKLPRWTSKHAIPSSSNNKDHRRSKKDMAGTPSKNNLVHRLSDWDTMFLNHVVTPVRSRSRLPADLQAGKYWLHQQRLLHAALKNGKCHHIDPFQRVQALCRFNLLKMNGVEM